MTTITARIDPELDNSLSFVAKELDRSKGYVIREALKSYITDMMEDMEDYRDATAILKENNTRISWEEVQRNCGLLED